MLCHHRPDGKTFSVPSENLHIPSPKIGDVVTFSYESNIRRDVPFQPKIYKIRHDILWEEVIHSSLKENMHLTSMYRIVKVGIGEVEIFYSFIHV